ncbi:hypothetical protein FEM48_Zijuj01G0100900 [Ziziphus jujuba var. spinosa]|uniref:Gnk2-homologous domain-containing protein n=1 Tax=Ziziphus jujuba var. spinosa TaxID=714518 RepID=A0A978W0M0_ZIZJJ|nr:hypothetical protein FEM48_Zijuj01G0100900 [Ziziphus jujuba var. spinosa]
MTTPSGYMNMAVPAVITWLFIRLSIFSEAVPEYRYHDCPNTTTFTPNSIYQSNLNQVLSSLTSNSTRDTGFYNTSIGQDPGTVVYGLFLCRGDVTINMCQECLTTAAKDLVETYCPIEKVAVIWYDHCMVRYSNESFFGNMVQDPSISLYNIQDISEPVRFNQLLQVSMNDSRTKAVDAPTGAKRYEIYPFYQLAAAPTPTPGSDGPTPGSDGKSQSSTTLIISITAPVAFVLFLSSVAFYFLRRRATDKYKAIQERNDGNEITTVESLQLDLSTIKAATNNFSDGNKLGEGGFGEVFKRMLMEVVLSLLDSLRNEAAGGDSGKKYAAGNATIAILCEPDLP